MSRTWLIAVMHGEKCIAAETIVGSRNYLPRLLEICSIISGNMDDWEGWEVIVVRDSWHTVFGREEIERFAAADSAGKKGTQ